MIDFLQIGKEKVARISIINDARSAKEKIHNIDNRHSSGAAPLFSVASCILYHNFIRWICCWDVYYKEIECLTLYIYCNYKKNRISFLVLGFLLLVSYLSDIYKPAKTGNILFWCIFYRRCNPCFKYILTMMTKKSKKINSLITTFLCRCTYLYDSGPLTLSLLGYLKTRICWGGVNLIPPLNPMFYVQIWQMIHH